MIFPRYQKKAALDLSVSFMVKLILAITVFSFGLVIMRNIFSTAGSGELTRNIDAEVEQQIMALMDSGEKIIVFPEEIETSRNRVAVFGLGVVNILGYPTDTEFTVFVQCFRFIDRSDQVNDCPEGSESWTFSENPPMTIANHEEGTTAIPVLPSNAELGTYIYNVKVEYYNSQLMEHPDTFGITKFRVVVT